ncbi:PqiC family protein [Pseudomonas kulmbachensis]|uniref:Membrane integrity-associated transporter subunit PqiC n=1 Tax=Pseudomonas kulmbachensis TaxID=3043408 RepID=A0ABW7LVR3_9PSED
MRAITVLLFAGLGLVGCSSPTLHYYTLLGNSHETQSSSLPPDYQFEMLPVRVPLSVDQPQIVVRQDQGRLAVLENDRWAAPLSEEFQEALSVQLERKLGTRDLAGFAKDPLHPVLSVQVDVRRFESLPGGYALIDTLWSVAFRAPDQPRRTLTCASRIQEPADSSLSNVVLVHQRLIEELATRIANQTDVWVKDAAQTCTDH